MKKLSLFLFLLLGIIEKGFCYQEVLNVTNVSHPTNVDQFDLFEVSFSTVVTGNPYDPDSIDVYAVFVGPNNCRDTVIGFYYEDFTFEFDTDNGCEKAVSHPSNNGWRVRYTPKYAGTWGFYIVAIHTIPGSIIYPPVNKDAIIYHRFTCLPVEEANGFISLANNRFLKREVVRNYQTQDHSFFPIGPNIANYGLNGSNARPLGIYDYEYYLDSLYTNGNYMRVFINRFRHLNLFGPEYAQPESGIAQVYFDSTINQKDAAELDYILEYAAEHDVCVMLTFFCYVEFAAENTMDSSDPGKWSNNPYNGIIDTPCEFFSDPEAVRITKNMLRYIVARWGYATNIVAWELWNEVSNMFGECENYNGQLHQEVLDWHEEMSGYLREIDPFGHCVTTSMGSVKYLYPFFTDLFSNMDFVSRHLYANIQKAKSKEQTSKLLLDTCLSTHLTYPAKPFFMEEFGFGQDTVNLYDVKDPYGIDLHNYLWTSLFSSSMGSGSIWWWQYLMRKDLFRHFKPMLTFCSELPILSDLFTGYTTGTVVNNKFLVFPQNIQTYYMKNQAEDTIYGWCQDTAMAYQSLRWLTDSVYLGPAINGREPWHFLDSIVLDPDGYVYTLFSYKKPLPSSNSNNIVIPVANQPVNTCFEIKWYDAETGLETNNTSNIYVQQNASKGNYLSFSFPSSVRNLQNHVIVNKYGDAVFRITKKVTP